MMLLLNVLNVVFGSPFSDTYPSFIWKSLKKSRKGKDIFNPFFYALNKTKKCMKNVERQNINKRHQLYMYHYKH
ncbi:hypothetical protein PFFCH_04763 [Plasmodium falciparum FCH/4]|uniref:Uncharacterized protein n=1 Tax=Plasmodium falciparum FCH/4 TaxID=1036724 RepID=A0A024VGD5_PLAFA|nr:hypothetical protein PFFCH_04763 [Plasmodium falciparum FCH/4]